MHAIDWCIIVGYFALVIGVATWVTKRNKDTADDFFLAGRNLAWWVIGASIFSSNIGSEHLVGLAGSGATDGVAMAHYELHAWCVLILGWILIPFFMRGKVFTMPEFLEKRFSPGCRTFLSIVSLVSYVVTKVAVGIFAGGVVFSALLPDMHLGPIDSFWIGSIIVLCMAGLYVILGGMRAVAYTDVIQVSVLVLGSGLLTYFGLKALGGWDVLRSTLGSEMFNLWKPLIPAGVEGTWEPVKETGRMAWYFNANYPWIGMLFCAPIVGLWYWCTDQYIVQRALGAPSQKEARRGCIFAGALKLLPVFIFIIPGMICFALAKSGQYETLSALVNQDGSVNRAAAQGAFPLLVQTVLPIGVRGIVVAGLIAALMGSLAGTFNASSTLFTMDVYRRLKPQASQASLVWVGRIAIAVMVVIGLLWIQVIRGADGLYNYLQSVQGYLAPPIFVVFFFGIFWKRLNAKGCLAALIVGFAVGIFRMAVDTPVTLGLLKDGYAEGSFFWIVNNFYFQYFSVLITLIAMITMVVVSYATREPDYAKIKGLTYGNVTPEQKRETRASWNWVDVAGTVAVLLMILGAYIYFNG
ncbi:MAG: sodium:solute symporter [Verrucomicrobia bacterium]|nr:sodium:solute symporter [Verrucomicrobiota bacterium]MBR5736995.1 sodium:solute symporter [Verrucomicrobiota bacterium]MBR6461472.1 sodium:solute symporter [Verrucomicrobiota bacterium]MBR6464374.1 sodium:solute symporter [Verrucomicrobiota bacterium]